MGKTILFVSHDLSSIGKYCDRVVLLNRGQKLAEGGAKEMVNLYRKVLVNQLDDEEAENSGDHESIQEETDSLQKEKLNLNPELLEYGSKLAEIVDFGIYDHTGLITNAVDKGQKFSVKMKVKFNEDISELIFAFTIKDLKGTELTGTNTMYENSPVTPKNQEKSRKLHSPR